MELVRKNAPTSSMGQFHDGTSEKEANFQQKKLKKKNFSLHLPITLIIQPDLRYMYVDISKDIYVFGLDLYVVYVDGRHRRRGCRGGSGSCKGGGGSAACWNSKKVLKS